MKRIVFTHLTIIWLLTLLVTACTPPAEPVSVTRPVIAATEVADTAVPPTHTPPATSTIAPTNTPDPATAQARFLETLQLELNGRQFDSLEAKLNTPFLTGIYPVATLLTGPRNIIPYLQDRLLDQSPNITFYELDSTEIPNHLTAVELFGENAGQATVIGSSGWGLNGSGQALIYLLAKGDSFLWAGLVVGYGDFEANLELETIAAPTGLIYLILGIESGRYEYWQIDANGDPQLLIAHNGRLSLNPTATLALAAESENEFITLFDLADGSSEVIEVDGRLMTSRVQWLNNETALLLLTDEPGVHQGTFGYPAFFNVSSGQLIRLDLELSTYAQPTISANDTITFSLNNSEQLVIWQNGELKTVEVAGLQGWPKSFRDPVLSPNGSQVIGKTSTNTEPARPAYGQASLNQPEFTILHAYEPVGTDAVVPLGINWSPDGQWVALTPSSFDIVESGPWLISADGSTKIFLGPGSRPPVWLDADRLVFSAFWNGQFGLQLYNLATNERYWLDTPQFAASLRQGFLLEVEKVITPVQFISAAE